MSKRAVIITVSAVLAVLIVAGGGLFVYDQGNKDQIAKGVQVGGVDVGGLSATAARAKIRHAYLGQLRRPVVIHSAGHTFRLSARQARITANVGAMVDEAVARSRQGDPFTRAVRDLQGGTVNVNLTPQVTYSEAAVVGLLNRVKKSVNRPSQDATVSFTAGTFTTVAAKDGLQVRLAPLHRRIDKVIVSPDASRRLIATTRRTVPKVTTAAIDKKYGTTLVVDRSNFTLKLYKNLKLLKTYSVAVGQQGLETPAGLYNIQDKQIDPAWHVPLSAWTGKLAGQTIPGGTPQNPLKARWLGIFDGAGIHGVDPSEYGSIGHAASHGCVRMRIPDVIDLYDRVPVGAPIYIS